MTVANKKILVTGGAGFIGSHLVEELLRRRALVHVVDDLSRGGRANLKKAANYTFRKIDMTSESFVRYLKKEKFDLIYHLAAVSYAFYSVKSPKDDFEKGLIATFNLLEAVREHKLKSRIIYMSSVAVHGSPKKIPIREDHPLCPIAPYGVTKLAGEGYMQVYARIYGLKTLIVRGFSFYGPRQRQQIVFDFIQKLVKNPQELTIIGDGSQERDMLYVKDIVSAFMRLTQKGSFAGEVYNLGSGKKYSTYRCAREVARAMKLKPKFSFTGSVRPGDAQVWLADITKIKKATGFKPKYSLTSGISETVKWYISEYGL